MSVDLDLSGPLRLEVTHEAITVLNTMHRCGFLCGDSRLVSFFHGDRDHVYVMAKTGALWHLNGQSSNLRVENRPVGEVTELEDRIKQVYDKVISGMTQETTAACLRGLCCASLDMLKLLRRPS